MEIFATDRDRLAFLLETDAALDYRSGPLDHVALCVVPCVPSSAPDNAVDDSLALQQPVVARQVVGLVGDNAFRHQRCSHKPDATNPGK